MPIINPSNTLASLIKSQASKIKSQGAEHKPQTKADIKSQVKSGHIQETSEQRLSKSITAINRHDPDAPKKAFRAYLAYRLIKELGDQVLRDPEFPALVDRTQQTMMENEDIRQSIEKAGLELLSPPSALS